ncbi:MAG: serine--tRNA ligase [Chloroflexota bacterium]
MLSLKFIRENPDLVRQAVAKRRDTAPIDEILSLDERRRALLTEAESLKALRNQTSQQIGRMKEKPPALIEEMRRTGDRIKSLDAELAQIDGELERLLLYVPNVPHPSVPEGEGEEDNVVARTWGDTGVLPGGEAAGAFPLRSHWEVASELGIIDFERGAKIGGSGFVLYLGLGARLERALINWMIDLHVERHGYTEAFPPFLANRASMVSTTQIPKFEFDMYRVEGEELYLIPTAEVPLTNIYRNEVIPFEKLPIYFTGYSACFRKEAGSAGKDTRGLLRVHEFNKVEMVKFVLPEASYRELDSLVQNAEEVLQGLNLAYRVLEMCTADLGFGQTKKYDLEVWAPGVGRWLEVSSCSNFEEFQARRANIRFRRAAGEHLEYVHTLNGSGLATPRTIVAIIESYQQPDGSVVVPEVLRPYMGGKEVIR